MTDIDFDELLKNLNDFLVVDVRTRKEMIDDGQIPGSHLLHVQELEKALGMTDETFKCQYGFPKLRPDDETLVITCRSGRRVGIADCILKEHGFTDKHRLYCGSLLDWVKNDGPLIKPGQPYEPPPDC